MINEYIEKYFSGECSEAEKEKLLQYFREHPSEMEGFFFEEEWDAVVHAPAQQTPAAENFIDQLMDEDAPPKRKIGWGKWVAAAAIIVFISLAAIFFFNLKGDSSVSRLAVNTSSAASLEPEFTIKKNDEVKPVNYALPDGSIVTLSAHSEIKYARLFENNKRDIVLEGEAVFQVAKDARRPFTVYCKEVATTALGTKFKVSALKDNGHVSVVLLEGKIVVKSTAATYTGDKYYLLPGNEIQYDRKNSRFTINKDIIPVTPDMAVANPTDEDLTPTEQNIIMNAEKKAIQFNDVGMAKVLNVIARKYSVSIAYPTDRVSNIRFVGTIRQSDPIEKILSDITQMNNLELIYDTAQHRYVIR